MVLHAHKDGIPIVLVLSFYNDEYGRMIFTFKISSNCI
ncbi:transposase [Bacillus mycoides]|nr:transposase [Bacillus mycoides]